MENQIMQIAARIKEARESLEIGTEEMAGVLEITPEEYEKYEAGEYDFSFTFLYKCANVFHMDITELMTGDVPKLSTYSLVRAGKGLPLVRRQSFQYQNLAYFFKHRLAEPFMVTAPYREDEQDKPIALSSHKGQEMDYIISGQLKVAIENHIEVLGPGDTIYYDASKHHGMIATGGEDCVFLAFVIGEE